MHTFTYTPESDGEPNIHFHHNSDLSGNVHIASSSQDGFLNMEFSIPGRALLEFIASYVATQRIAALEQVTPESILGIPLE